MRPVDVLREAANSDTPDIVIISKAMGIPADIRGEAHEGRVQTKKWAVKVLVEKAESLGRKSRLSAASRITRQLETSLTNNQPEGNIEYRALTIEDATDKLMELHPKLREDGLDNLPDLEAEDHPGIVVTSEDILKGIRLLPKDLAQGASGLTNNVLKFLGSFGTEVESALFSTRVAAVFNKIYTRFMWTRTRSVLIPKPVPGAYRPIGIGDSMYRLLMKVAYSRNAAAIGESLAPRQLAVGVPGGSEMGARVVHLHYHKAYNRHDEWQLAPAIIKVDCKNCWNEASTALAFAKLKELAPDLVRLFYWTHVDPSDLVYGGAVVGHREVGFRQGDPASTINASLALEYTMDRVGIKLKEIIDEMRAEYNWDADVLNG